MGADDTPRGRASAFRAAVANEWAPTFRHAAPRFRKAAADSPAGPWREKPLGLARLLDQRVGEHARDVESGLLRDLDEARGRGDVHLGEP